MNDKLDKALQGKIFKYRDNYYWLEYERLNGMLKLCKKVNNKSDLDIVTFLLYINENNEELICIE